MSVSGTSHPGGSWSSEHMNEQEIDGRDKDNPQIETSSCCQSKQLSIIHSIQPQKVQSEDFERLSQQ